MWWRRRKQRPKFDPEAGELPEHIGDPGVPGLRAIWVLLAVGLVGLLFLLAAVRDIASDPGDDDDGRSVQQNGPAEPARFTLSFAVEL